MDAITLPETNQLYLVIGGQAAAARLLSLSRAPEKYRSPSPAARAAMQLRSAGKEVQPGQRVPFVYVLGKERVWAWDRPEPLDPRRGSRAQYRKLLLRAAADVFQPFGITAEGLELRLEGGSGEYRTRTGRKFTAGSKALMQPVPARSSCRPGAMDAD